MIDRPRPPLALIADDLTGSCDAGVHFLRTGWAIDVMLEPERPLPSGDLTVISTNTRGLAPSEAAHIVHATALRVKAAGRALLYKKFDSTLHGNFGAEIAAVISAGLAECALICPAFPDMGRRLQAGELLMGDEKKPVGRNVVTTLRDQSGWAVAALGVEVLRSPVAAVAAGLRERVERGERLFAFDAEEESDLARVVELGGALGSRALLCGSTGLARHLGRSLAQPDPKGEARCLPAPSSTVPLVCVIGSRSLVTQRQVDRLLADREGVVIAREQGSAALAAALDRCAPTVVRVSLDAVGSAWVAEVMETLRGRPPVALMLSGGDTARLVCHLSGAHSVQLLGEIETGFPYGRLVGGWFDGWPVATKAGGFGKLEALIECADCLGKRGRPHRP